MPINGLFTPNELDSIDKAIAYVEKNYRNSISADQLAIEAGIDIKQLQTGIKAIKGLTLHNFLLATRISRSLCDLQDFARPIKLIALRHGFCSPSHFATEFKKRMGLTPKEYRYHLILLSDRIGKPTENRRYCYANRDMNFLDSDSRRV